MYYSNIIEHDTANGPGWRTTLFVSGCRNYCPNCFNQEAQNFEYGELFTPDDFFYILTNIDSPTVDGLSILGGDPLWQEPEDMLVLMRLCDCVHMKNKTVWLWTGFTWEEIFENSLTFELPEYMRPQLIEKCDVVVDGPFVEAQKDLTLKWKGSTNQRVIDVQASLSQDKIILWNEGD